MEQLILLAPFTHYYAFEPDHREAQELVVTLKSENVWRNVTVLSDAISSTEGKATLYITKQPGLSSILKPNYDVINKYYTDPVFGIESTVEVPTISLDHAAERNDFQDACFLKVDTQGSELDIMKSGKRLLEKNVLGVYVEVGFHRFYVDQPLFSDVDLYLRNLSFSLFDLHRVLMRRGSHQSDLYSRRQVIWAHALYMKEPDTILQGDDDEVLLRATRLLGLALAFEHFDIALELASSKRLANLITSAYGFQIQKDVEEFVRHRTGVLLDKFHSDKSLPNCTTSIYKDRKHILSHEHYQLLQKYAQRNRQHQKLGQKYEKLDQRKTILIARKLKKHPSVAKSLSIGQDLLSRISGLFRNT
jgi:FkbM family methyltransferase